MMTTLAVTELQARAHALDSAIGLLRLRLVERSFDVAAITRYKWRGRREFDRLVKLLRHHWHALSYAQLARIADILEMAEVLNPLRESSTQHNWIERRIYRGLCRLENDVENLAAHLRREAHQRMRAFGNAPLSDYHQQQAAFANAFLHRVNPDPAEAFADPDYGF